MRAMIKHVLFATLFVLTLAGSASAGGSEGSVGVGAEYLLRGGGGVSVNYDAGTFHTGGFLFFSDDEGPNNTNVGFGGRFYYHVHSTGAADFGLGGGLGINVDDNPGPDDGSSTYLFLEPGAQIRAFVVPNVALSFTAGLSLGLADASGLLFNGVPVGGAGVHYYFF